MYNYAHFMHCTWCESALITKCICVSGSYSQQWPDDKEILLELVYKHFTFYGVDCKR